MSALLALIAARRAGANVFVRADKLVVQSQGDLPADVCDDLRLHRDTLIKYLTLGPTTLEEWCAEYDRLGLEVDDLHDQAQAARAAGDLAAAQQLAQQCRDLVEGPYRHARDQVGALSSDAAPEAA